MTPDQIKALIDASTSQLLWWAIGVAVALWAKQLIENAVQAAVFYLRHDFAPDDVVLIDGKRKARIVRQTLSKTVFYLYDNKSRLIVPNRDFDSLRCEKVLPGHEPVES